MGFPMAGQDSSVGTDQGASGSGGAPQNNGGQGGVHPAWNELLGVVPQELHSQVIPHLQKYNQNTEKVHERYNPYKDFVDNRVDPERIRQALAVAEAIEGNPQEVYQLLHQQFGQQQSQQSQGLPGVQNGNQQLQQGQGDENPYEGLHPSVVEKLQMLDQMKGGFDTMAELMLSQRQQSQQAEEDAELQAVYDNFSKSNPVFAELNKDGAAEPYVNSLLMAGYKPEEAMQMFEQFVGSVKQYQNRPQPPMLLGPGASAVPGQQTINPAQLSRPDTKNLVASMLDAARSANQ